MGEPNFPCFRQESPFLDWSVTTTTTSTTIEPDYFIIPASGTSCKYEPILASAEVSDVLGE